MRNPLHERKPAAGDTPIGDRDGRTAEDHAAPPEVPPSGGRKPSLREDTRSVGQQKSQQIQRFLTWHAPCVERVAEDQVQPSEVEGDETMKRYLVGRWVVASALLLMGAAPATAQISANIQLSWHRSDDGWRSTGPVVDGYVRHDRIPVRSRVIPVTRTSFRVPPGHMPPPGLCRAWVIGRPPGLQPRPDSCNRLFRSHWGPGVVILHSPARHDKRWRRYDRDRWDDDWDDDDQWDRDDRGRKDRGRPGRGRGGRP